MKRYTGGPILRYGGKVRHAAEIVPRLPRGKLFVEPFFGAGGLFFANVARWEGVVEGLA